MVLAIVYAWHSRHNRPRTGHHEKLHHHRPSHPHPDIYCSHCHLADSVIVGFILKTLTGSLGYALVAYQSINNMQRNHAMSNDLKQHVQSIANNLSNPPMDEWNEGRDIDSEGEFSAFDYLQDALDIEYIVNSKGEYLGARVLVAFGGPNIWVNTRTKTVEGYWWGDSAFASFEDNLGLDDALSELWACR